MANYIDKTELLQDKRVREEIARHLWIESEKAGEDIGLESAQDDWLKRFSKAWMSYNMPDTVIRDAKEARAEREASKSAKSKPKKTPLRRSRSAKSYLK